jgi:site-specific DNA-methyltransferase (adenine-specific)
MIGTNSIDTPWKDNLKNMGNRLHGICSYMAMFPPSIPNYYIKKYSKEGEKVLDQFSGRGTTPLEACMLGRFGIGNDKNPLAFVLTKAKVEIPDRQKIINRINEMWSKYKKIKPTILDKEEWNIRMLFSDYTLRQILFLKNELKWKNSNVDAFIAAMLLGIIHGSSIGYLSISMPNTFSMAPNYVKNYIKKNKLPKQNRDVFELLLKKLNRCYQKTKMKGKVYMSDARKISRISDNSIKLSVTSPPYIKVIRYGDFNWIRLWFLNYDAKSVDKKLFCSQSLSLYENFMSAVLKENWRVLTNDGIAVYVIGDVRLREKNEIINLANFVWENCAEKVGFKLIESIKEDPIKDSTKVSKIWGKTRGMATKTDRVLIMQKNE